MNIILEFDGYDSSINILTESNNYNLSNDKEFIFIKSGNKKYNHPYIHYYISKEDKENNNGGCLMLLENKYYNHDNHNVYLNANAFNIINNFLHEKYPNSGNTYWHQLIKEWNIHDTNMPIYNYDTISQYTEDFDLLLQEDVNIDEIPYWTESYNESENNIYNIILN